MGRSWVNSADYLAAIETIVGARISCGVSQRELARRIGKPPSFINKIELRERRLDIIEFVIIARALNLEPSKLLAKVLQALPDAP
ncbi:helix-turn-helix domain-containing protein [Allosphingosinicella humi]